MRTPSRAHSHVRPQAPGRRPEKPPRARRSSGVTVLPAPCADAGRDAFIQRSRLIGRVRNKGKILVLHGADDPMVPDDQTLSFWNETRGAGANWQFVAYGKALHTSITPPLGRYPMLPLGYADEAKPGQILISPRVLIGGRERRHSRACWRVRAQGYQAASGGLQCGRRFSAQSLKAHLTGSRTANCLQFSHASGFHVDLNALVNRKYASMVSAKRGRKPP